MNDHLDLNQSSNHLDELTRHRMKPKSSLKKTEDLDKPLRDVLMQTLFFGIVVGAIIGIVLASFLHKYIVHPLGW